METQKIGHSKIAKEIFTNLLVSTAQRQINNQKQKKKKQKKKKTNKKKKKKLE